MAYDKLEYIFDQPTIIVVFCVVFFLIQALVEKVLRSLRLNITHKMNVLLLATIMVGIIAEKYMYCLRMAMFEDPELLLCVFHPLAILKVTFEINTRLFIKSLPYVVIISTLGIALISVLMGGAVVLWARLDAIVMPLYGLVMATIDYPDIPEYLKKFEHMKFTILLIQGEFILGAAFAFLGLDILIGMLDNVITHWYQVICISFRMIFGGILVGLLIGKLSSYSMIKTNIPSHVALLLVNATFATYFLCLYFFHVSATLATFIVAFMMSRLRYRLYQETDAKVRSIIDAFFYIAECCCFLAIWILLVILTVKTFVPTNCVQYLIVFITSIIARFIQLLMFYPMFLRLGHNWSVKTFVSVFWLTRRGILQILVFNIVCHYRRPLGYLEWLTPHTLFLCVLHNVFNDGLGIVLLKRFGITTMSAEKLTNVNNSMRILIAEKKRYLSIMKYNRFFMDARWSEIENEIHLESDLTQEEAEDNTYFGQPRVSRCEDCNKVIVTEPTKKEFKLINKAAKLRVLKATKISYVRQQEAGMLSKASLKVLLKLVEQAREENLEYFIDAKQIKAMFRRTGWPEKVRTVIRSLRVMRKFNLPRRKFRKWCYRRVQNKYYELIIYCITSLLFLLDIPSILYFGRSHLIIKLYLIFLSSCDLFMKINAYSRIFFSDGIRLFFSDLWNAFDLMIIILTSIEIIVYLVFPKRTMFRMSLESVHWMLLDNTLSTLVIIRFLRLLKVFVLLYIFREEMIQYCEKFVNYRIMTAYEIANAIIVAYTESIHMVSTYTYNEIAKRQILRRLKDDRMTLYKQLDYAQTVHPAACMNIKTRYIITIVLKYLAQEIENFKSSGFIDEYEYTKIMEGMEKCSIRARVLQRNIPARVTADTFIDIPWIHYFKENADLMYNNSLPRTFNANELIHNCNDYLPGVYVIIEGVVAMSYKASARVKMLSHNKLPSMDYIYKSSFEKTMKILIPGNTIGEMSIITKQAYEAQLRAITNVKLMLIPTYLLMKIMLLGNDKFCVANYIWKYIAFNIVLDILWEVPVFKSYKREEIDVYVNKGFVLKSSSRKVFISSELIEDIVLFQGQIEDLNTGNLYEAPIYLPRYVQKLRFLNPQEVPIGLYVIPLKTAYSKTIIENSYVEMDVARLRLLETRRTNPKIKVKRFSLGRRKSKDKERQSF